MQAKNGQTEIDESREAGERSAHEISFIVPKKL